MSLVRDQIWFILWPPLSDTLTLIPCDYPHTYACRARFSSGNLLLDLAMGGGFPKGKIVEVRQSCGVFLCSP